MISKNLNDKTYEQMISEAIAQIPMYSKEWTNYNASDPGIMMLENLSAFSVLQQEEMNEVSDAVKQKLLQMVGFYKRKGRPAKALLYPNGKEEVFGNLPYNQKLFAQHICYELDGKNTIETGKIKKIYTLTEDKVQDFSLLTEHFGIPGGTEIWGKNPVAGEELFIEIDEIPQVGEFLIFHVEIQENFQRNPLKKAQENPFVKMEWMMCTTEGYQPVQVKDYTAGFLFSGGIYIRVPSNAAVNENNRYVIKAVLKSAAYDISPCVQRIKGLLTEVVQIDTKGTVLSFEGNMEIVAEHFLLKNNYTEVYVLESDGAFHKYQEVQDGLWYGGEKHVDMSERFYIKEVLSETKIRIRFLEDAQYKPRIGCKNAIVVSVNSKDMMLHRHLGKLYGYDNQCFDLSPVKNLWDERLKIMAAVQNEGEMCYYFLPENESGSDEFSYRYIEEENVIEVMSCGEYEGAELYLAQCVTYEGEEGNVLPGNEFEFKVEDKTYSICNDTSDIKGYKTENVEDVRKRFVKDMKEAASIVTANDCEEIVKNIPGLSIHKVRATTQIKNNTIHVVIKPNSKYELPGVSEVYRKIVSEYLEQRRMLTSRIVVEEPIYIPIDVKGTIYMEKHFENGEQKIRDVLKEMLDYTKERGNFGETISYHKIYRSLEELDCVGEIYELSLIPQNMSAVKKIGLDWKLNDNCLCYPGIIAVELNTRHY